jgi:hypothetical protein
LDFQGLHNLAKHNIYLRENCESALATLDALRDHHKLLFGDHPTPSQEITRQALSYQRTLVQSTERRLCSMDRRIVNVIQLSFNIVTQGDSKLMQSESQSMKTIAVMTLFFMPLSTIAVVPYRCSIDCRCHRDLARVVRGREGSIDRQDSTRC